MDSTDDEAFPLEGGFPAAERLRAEAGRRGPACVARLEEVARLGTPLLRGAALEALFELDAAAGRALALAALEGDADNEVRGTAAALLGGCDDGPSLDVLVRALGDGSTFVRDGATRGLARRADAAGTRALFDAWRESHGPGAPVPPGRDRDRVERLLGLLSERLSDPIVGAYFLSPLDAHSPAALDDAVALLGRSGDPLAKGPLLDMLERGPGALRARAAEALCAGSLERAAAGRLAAALGRGFWPGDEVDPSILQEIASALLRHDPRWAFEALAPTLDARECSDRSGCGRAVALLSALERALADASREGDGGETSLLPDPRWRARCEALRDACGGGAPPEDGRTPGASGEGPGPIAGRVAAGLRWFEEGRPPVPPLDVELGQDDGGPMPLFIAGFLVEGESDLVAPLRTQREGAPEGLCVFRHQFGGYACAHATLLGYALAPGAAFVEGEAFASLRAALTGSSGEPLPFAALSEWGERLGLGPALLLAQGWEALLVGVPGQLLDPLDGLSVLGFRPRLSPWDERADFWCPPYPEVYPLGPFGRAHERALYEAGAALGLGAPRLGIVWVNSD
ncbi:MAG TPA: HEAT repeat domain-containing protein [Polyangiaceae bacterium]|nr:HEAT repeat domain-containing protein [Polyangiaceae bacterium]